LLGKRIDNWHGMATEGGLLALWVEKNRDGRRGGSEKSAKKFLGGH